MKYKYKINMLTRKYPLKIIQILKKVEITSRKIFIMLQTNNHKVTVLEKYFFRTIFSFKNINVFFLKKDK